MTISSKPRYTGALDTVLLVYSLLDEHPAARTCEEFIRGGGAWLSSVLVLMEARLILDRVYGTPPSLIEAKLVSLGAGPISFVSFDDDEALRAFAIADQMRIDLTDAALLDLCRTEGVTELATDDRKLARVAARQGLRVASPIDEKLRRAIQAWELTRLPLRGLPRILRRTHQWLQGHDPALADEFWSATGAGNHLP